MNNETKDTGASEHSMDAQAMDRSSEQVPGAKTINNQRQVNEANVAIGHANLIVPGMGSDHCAGLVKESLLRLGGVASVESNIALHRVSVAFDTRQLLLPDLQRAVERGGYEVDSISGEHTAQLTLTVPGMGSDHCAGLIDTSIRRLSGIYAIATNIGTHKVMVDYHRQKSSADLIEQAVVKAGYEVASVHKGSVTSPVENDSEERYLKEAWRRLWFAAIPTTLIMLLMIPQMFWQPIPGYLLMVALLAFPVVILRGGIATHRSAWRSLTNRTANMDVLISMGSLPPYLIGLIGFIYPMTSFIEMAATIMTFHLLGKYLETRAKGRASQAIKRLLTLGAKTATVLRAGKEAEVPIAELQVGDVMLVRPGGKIPTDGEIVDGVSHVDGSPVLRLIEHIFSLLHKYLYPLNQLLNRWLFYSGRLALRHHEVLGLEVLFCLFSLCREHGAFFLPNRPCGHKAFQPRNVSVQHHFGFLK